MHIFLFISLIVSSFAKPPGRSSNKGFPIALRDNGISSKIDKVDVSWICDSYKY
jgi:hypothetical protein